MLNRNIRNVIVSKIHNHEYRTMYMYFVGITPLMQYEILTIEKRNRIISRFEETRGRYREW